MKVILNKTTKIKGEFVLAGAIVEVNKAEKKKLEDGGFIDAEVKEISGSDNKELESVKAELVNTQDAFKVLEGELSDTKAELDTVKTEKEELATEFEALKAGTPDLLGGDK